ncbi:Mitogen-activated protein kinase [Plasmodiophora brassicae]|uniref:Mitogen-activated protein kinase n=1 Tax=Plasmodiophora brassicae TaxID=37360 RepID=A0A0G4J5Q0_PLABS|nr:MAPK4 [Plasmodiophora brassicae]CEP02900.1 hypothetical protein PBRA_002867 [Plasmodiophora brassicae]SPQ95005.1 unnamed protein product [Plasmodiophora brassicae]
MSEEVDKNVARRYEMLKKLGKGAYGIVWKAADKKAGKNVAVKKIFDAFQNAGDAQRTFREIVYLQELGGHDNIIKLVNVLKAGNDMDIYLVFELLETDVHNVIKANILEDVHKRYIVYQIAKALKYVHSAQLMHRDVKPSNVLIDAECHVKLCDFGLARSVKSQEHENNNVLTEYVATRWYRAPEILLGSTMYTTAIDMWSLGCILGELLKGTPMFPGTSTMNQIELILEVTDPPSDADIAAINSPYTVTMLESLKKEKSTSLAELFPNAPPDAISLLGGLLQFNPTKRLTAEQVLEHPYLGQFHDANSEPVCDSAIISSMNDDKKFTVEEYRGTLYQSIIERKKTISRQSKEAKSRRRDKSRSSGKSGDADAGSAQDKPSVDEI